MLFFKHNWSMPDSHLHLQNEQWKLGWISKHNLHLGIPITGNIIIGDILQQDIVLVFLFTINPFSILAPVLQHLLFSSPPCSHLYHSHSRSSITNATKMHSHIITFPSPNEILKLADHITGPDPNPSNSLKSHTHPQLPQFWHRTIYWPLTL